MRFLQSLEKRLRATRDLLHPLVYRGDAVTCPVCGRHARKFRRAGSGASRRDNAVCPFCRARERDRLLWLFFQRHPELFPATGLALLHVAPEPALEGWLRERCGAGYLSVDIYRDDVMEKMDITRVPRPDGVFDAIVCVHVVQNIQDDHLALAELYRVLKPGGWAVINVPMEHGRGTQTLQAAKKSSILDPHRPEGRHRVYGDDYLDSLRNAGFEVSEITATDLVPAAEAERLGIASEFAGHVHFCRKPRAGG